MAIPGHIYQDVTWVSPKLTPVDILPKPTASKRPWRVHHLQTCHGPPGTQLHLQASCEIRGPGKPLVPLWGVSRTANQDSVPWVLTPSEGKWETTQSQISCHLVTLHCQKMNPHRPTQWNSCYLTDCIG